MRKFISNLLKVTAILSFSSPALCEDEKGPAWSLSLTYKADIATVARGGAERGVRALDNLDIALNADLDQLIGWRGARIFVDGLNNMGGKPNDLAGTIQGVDNIEVDEHHAKIYQAWIEQKAGDHATILAGLYDLNSEFYHDDAAGLLLAPPFGVGSELSATGPNGPSIFPSTALAARLRVSNDHIYVQGAVLNAHAGTIGDSGGVDLSVRDGALLIAEAGWTSHGKIAVGAWRYTKRQPRIVAPGLTEAPPPHKAQGIYLLMEHDLAGSDGDARHVQGFLRAGLSDGKTTPFTGGWQAGILVGRPIAARPESAFSIGYADGALSSGYRMPVMADAPLPAHERMVELTYSDRLMKHVLLQPDVQYVFHPAGDSGLRNTLFFGLRLQIDLNIH